MPKAKNITSVSELKDKIGKTKGVVLTDYRGLTHKQLEDLHRKLRKVSGEYLVVKNNLLKIAARDTEYAESMSNLTGPTGAMFTYDDEISPIKELYKFIKATSLPKVKGGIISKKNYDEKEMAVVAALPSRDILVGQVVGGFQSPLSGFVSVLNGNLSKLVYVLGQIRKT